MKNTSKIMMKFTPVMVLMFFFGIQFARPATVPDVSLIAYNRVGDLQAFAARLSISPAVGMGDLRRFEGESSVSFLEALKTRQSLGMGELRRFEGQSSVSFLEALKTRQSVGMGELRRFEAQFNVLNLEPVSGHKTVGR